MAATLVLSACAGGYNPQYQINEIVIVNNSGQALRDVSIRADGRVFSCDNVAPHGICADRFPRRNYVSDTIEIEWALGNGPRQSGSLQGQVPATFITGLALRGVLEVGRQGEIDAYFEQETPFR
jgi:hypothetical protein